MTEALKLKLLELREKESQLKLIIDRRFSSEDDFIFFSKTKKEMFEEYKNIKEEIKKIEWELMSSEEKKAHLKYLKDLKEKFKDEE